MKAIILAGGKGTRLREVVEEVPKPMALVAGKPFLEYLILQLMKQSISDIIISIGYKGDIIKSYFGNGSKWNASLTYSYEDAPLGTGGAIKKAVSLIDDQSVIIINGDSFLDLNFNVLIDCHNDHNSKITIGLVKVDDVKRYGKIDVNEKGEIISFSEKSRNGAGIINGGYYILNREIFDNLSIENYSLEREVLPKFINQGLYGMVTEGFFTDIGIPKDYLGLCKEPGKLLNAVIKKS